MREVSDALGRRLRLPERPRRIVSLVPSITATLADLGLDEEVVGLTTFCVRPAGWRERKRRVGGTKDVRADRVADLQPDLILANKEENERAQVEPLEALAPVYVTDVATVEQAIQLIETLGELTDRRERGQALAAEVRAGFAALAPAATPRRVAYLIWRRPYMAAGGGTFVDDVLRRGGLANAFGDRPRYPEVSAEELAGADALLLSSEPFPFAEKHRDELAAQAPGVPALLVDGELFSWWGSRLCDTPDALRAVRARLEER